ncbi:MAG: VWA domain-containing protein [Planctomycetota bacterium]|nr:VWA domain-containing protein [Planctomycetota bacterium]
MQPDATPAPIDEAAGPPKTSLLRVIAGWALVSLAVHMLLFLGLFLLARSGVDMPEPVTTMFAACRLAPSVGEESVEEEFQAKPRPLIARMDEGLLDFEVHRMAVIRDEAVCQEVETDNDLPYEESFRESEGRGGAAPGAQPGAHSAESAAHAARPEGVTEGYDRIDDNPFLRTADADTSTFSIDVDTASYANVRRYLDQHRALPPKDAVRIEELLNYFRYDYAADTTRDAPPFRTHVAVTACPWNSAHRLARIALQGRVLAAGTRPAANLVFLLDVSGSMQDKNKLDLLQKALARLVRRLDPRDRVALVVYAGAAGLVLPSTLVEEAPTIVNAIQDLSAGGSTNGGEGIVLAYQVAAQNFIEGGLNRVILATDGDFNVGVSNRGDLTRLIEEKAKTGVFLSVLGVGHGNYQDAAMEEFSNRGNGNYAYLDTLREADKALGEQVDGTLVTIAKDVKIQVFFNPERVAGYRLIGYENRRLARADFNDDKKDAGEIGAGHSVTALYEIVPAGTALPGADVDPNPFVRATHDADPAPSTALFRLRLRYKLPAADTSVLIEQDVEDAGTGLGEADGEVRWAAAVAAFGMLLRESPHKGTATWDLVKSLATNARGADPAGYRSEFLELVDRAKRLSLAAGR